MSARAEIVVIGAGVAGLAAAIAARMAGLSVTVIERETAPPVRPGETLHPGAGPVFERLGLLTDIEGIATSRPLGIEVVGPSVTRLPFGGPVDGPWTGYQISRERLSQAMVKRARALGARFRFGSAVRGVHFQSDQVTIDLPERSATADWCFDATGFANLSHRKLSGRMQQLGPQMTVRYRYRCDGSVSENWPRITLRPDGWRWLARLTPDRIAEVELIRGRRFETVQQDAGWAYADGTWRVSESPAQHRLFRIGDAGGRLDPAAGKGVLRAAMSAMMAVHLVAGVQNRRVSAAEVSTYYSRWFSEWVVQDCQELAPLVSGPGSRHPEAQPGRSSARYSIR